MIEWVNGADFGSAKVNRSVSWASNRSYVDADVLTTSVLKCPLPPPPKNHQIDHPKFHVVTNQRSANEQIDFD